MLIVNNLNKLVITKGIESNNFEKK